jgi:hypothetical protein
MTFTALIIPLIMFAVVLVIVAVIESVTFRD